MLNKSSYPIGKQQKKHKTFNYDDNSSIDEVTIKTADMLEEFLPATRIVQNAKKQKNYQHLNNTYLKKANEVTINVRNSTSILTKSTTTDTKVPDIKIKTKSSFYPFEEKYNNKKPTKMESKKMLAMRPPGKTIGEIMESTRQENASTASLNIDENDKKFIKNDYN